MDLRRLDAPVLHGMNHMAAAPEDNTSFQTDFLCIKKAGWQKSFVRNILMAPAFANKQLGCARMVDRAWRFFLSARVPTCKACNTSEPTRLRSVSPSLSSTGSTTQQRGTPDNHLCGANESKTEYYSMPVSCAVDSFACQTARRKMLLHLQRQMIGQYKGGQLYAATL